MDLTVRFDEKWLEERRAALLGDGDDWRLVDKATKEEVGRAMDELMCLSPRR